MRGVVVTEPGGPEALELTDRPDPEPAAGEVVLRVAAAGLNRADLLQRQGLYPVPPGASDVFGMEASGTIAALGPDVEGWAVGDPACALLAAGGYATHVAVPAGQLMPVPDGVSLLDAASLPEVAATVWSNVFGVGALTSGDSLLVHGGSGGIGTFAIQLAVARGARVLTTAGSPEKQALCRSLGADVVIDYREQDFVEVVREQTEGRGVDVVLDNMGGSYLSRNVAALATEGRVVIIGLQGGAKGELDINALLRKRGAVHATALRARPTSEKSEICRELVREVWPLVASGAVRTLVDRTFPLAEVAAAHAYMESGDHTGKILLVTD